MTRHINNIFDIGINDLTEEMYLHHLKDVEMEHQIGRLSNMAKIIRAIRDENILGDFIEFGVYKGFSLMWLARLRDLYGLNDRKIIGVDSFGGLPMASGPWIKDAFSDTNEEVVDKTLQSNLLDAQRKNIVIIKSWFDDPALVDKLRLDIKSLALIHMDCDLKVSLRDAFSLIEPCLRGSQYLLLDDWGVCESEIPVGFDEWKTGHPFVETNVVYSTHITRYYKTRAPLNDQLISVVMPLYNHCTYVAESINSILKQDHAEIELIIVDDGSTDGSSDIAKSMTLTDSRITYVRQDNRGTGDALNTGFRLAKGKYGTWVSSDNVYYPDMLSTFLNFLRSNESDFVFSSFDMRDELSNKITTFKLGGINEPALLANFIDISARSCITGMCYLYTMDLKNKCGNFIDVPGEDYYMGVLMGFKTRVGYVPKPLGMYRVHKNSVSHRLKEDSSLHVKKGGVTAVEMVKRLILSMKEEGLQQ
jgi:hypothetical protein